MKHLAISIFCFGIVLAGVFGMVTKTFIYAQEPEPEPQEFGTLTPELKNLFTNKGFSVLKATYQDMTPQQQDAFKALLLPHAFPSGVDEDEAHPEELETIYDALAPAVNRDVLFEYVKTNIDWGDES